MSTMAHRNESNAINKHGNMSHYQNSDSHVNHLFTPYNTDTYHISFNRKKKYWNWKWEMFTIIL